MPCSEILNVSCCDPDEFVCSTKKSDPEFAATRFATSLTSQALFDAETTPRPIAVSVPPALVVLTTSKPVYLPDEAPEDVIAPLEIVPAKVEF